MLGGHVEVGSKAYLGGAVAVHQFCRIGRLAMIGGMARVVRDVPPFVMLDGDTAMVVGLNKVGLRRAGFTGSEIRPAESRLSRDLSQRPDVARNARHAARRNFRSDRPPNSCRSSWAASAASCKNAARRRARSFACVRDEADEASVEMPEAEKKVG